MGRDHDFPFELRNVLESCWDSCVGRRGRDQEQDESVGRGQFPPTHLLPATTILGITETMRTTVIFMIIWSWCLCCVDETDHFHFICISMKIINEQKYSKKQRFEQCPIKPYFLRSTKPSFTKYACEGHVLEWRSICYSIRRKKHMILREVSKGAGRLPVGGTIVFSKVCGRSRLCVHSFYIVCPPHQ